MSDTKPDTDAKDATEDTNETVNTDVNVNTNGDANGNVNVVASASVNDDTSKKLAKELGRRPSIAELEIKSIIQDPKQKDIDKKIVKSNLEFALTMRPDANSVEIQDKDRNAPKAASNSEITAEDNDDNSNINNNNNNNNSRDNDGGISGISGIGKNDDESSIALPHEHATNPEISATKAQFLTKQLSKSSMTQPSMVNNNIIINKNDIDSIEETNNEDNNNEDVTTTTTRASAIENKENDNEMNINNNDNDNDDETKDDSKTNSEMKSKSRRGSTSRRVSRIQYVDVDSDDEVDPSGGHSQKNKHESKIQEEDESGIETGNDANVTDHYNDSTYYKDLAQYTPNPDGDIKPPAYMSNEEFEQYMQSRRDEALSRQLKRRPSKDQLVLNNIIPYNDSRVAPTLQGNAQSLQNALKRRPSIEQPQLAALLQSQQERENVMRQRKQSLASDLSNRATLEELIKAGIISVDYAKMAPFLQNKATQLEESLTNRQNQNMPGASMASKDYTLQQLQNNNNYGYSNQLSRTLHSTAQQLDKHRRRDSLAAALQQRPTQEYLQSRGVIAHSANTANSIQPQMQSLEAQLLLQQAQAAQQNGNNMGQGLPRLNGNMGDDYWDQMAPRLQGNAKALYKAQRRNSLKRALESRPDMQELQDSGVLLYNNNVSPMLQQSAAAIERKLARRPSVENVALKQIPLNGQNEYATQKSELEKHLARRPTVTDVNNAGIMPRPNLSNNLQPTAETIEQLLKRLNPQQQQRLVSDERFRNEMAPSILAAAQQLEAQKRKEQLAQRLNARMDKQALVDSGVMYSDPSSMASSLQVAGSELESQLQQRISGDHLARVGIMQNPKLDSSLHGAAHNVEQQLRLNNAQSMNNYNDNGQSPAAGLASPRLDRSLQSAARQLEQHQRRDTLTAALHARPDMQELIDAGYIAEYGNRMADSLQPAAQQLEERLQYQVSIEFLRKKGVLPTPEYNDNLDASLQPTADKLSELLTIESRKEDNREIASSLQAVAKKLEQSKTKDAVSQKLKARGTAEESGVNTSVAPQLQAIMKSLETQQKKDAVSKDLQQRGTAEQAGVDNNVAPSLQAAAKALDQAKKKDAVSSGLQQRGTAEQSGVDTSIAASLQATAKMLEQARKRDALSSGLQQRGTAEQAGVDNSLAPSLQSVAKQLEAKQKQLMMKQHLQARPDQQELLDQNILYSHQDQIAPNLQSTSAELRDQLNLRVSQQYLQNRGVLLSPTLSSNLQPMAGNVQQMLINRPNTAPLNGDNNGNYLAPNLQAAAKALEYKQRILALNRNLQARSNEDELRDSNILKYNNVSGALQPNANELEAHLARQLSKGYLQSAGILQYNEQMSNSLQPTANSLNAQLLDRPKTAPGYYSDSLAPRLHGAARKLDKKKKEEKLKRSLEKRANRDWLAKKGFLDLRDEESEPSHKHKHKHKKKHKHKIKNERQRRMSLELDQSLQNRPHPDALVAQNILYSNPTSPSGYNFNLHASAKALEAAQKRQQLSQLLQSRPDLQYLVDSGVIQSSTIAAALQGNAADLENALKTQVTREYLEQQGYIGNSNIDPQYQPAATEIEKLLKMKQQSDQSGRVTGRERRDSESARLAAALQPAAKKLEFHQRRISLSQSLNARRDRQELMDSGVLYSNTMAPGLQGNATNLETQLKQQVAKDYLERTGILRENEETDASGYEADNNGVEYPQPVTGDRKRRLSIDLNQKFGDRPSAEDLMNLNILHSVGMANAIQAPAASVQQLLLQRQTSDQLRDQGILPYSRQLDPSLTSDAAALQKLLLQQQQQQQQQQNNMASALQGVAKQLQQAQTRDALNSGLQRRGDYSEYVSNSNVAPGLQATARALEQQKIKDAVSSGLSMRQTAEQLGVETNVAASLQATAKLLAAAKTRDAVSSSLGKRGTAEQAGVNTTMAANLQAAAKSLEQARTTDALSSSLRKRGTAQQAGVDTNMAASLQATAKALEQAKIKDAVSKDLSQRPTAQQAGVDTNMAASLQATAKALEQAKTRDAISSGLSTRPSAEQAGVDNSLAPSLQGAAKQLQNAQTKDSLSKDLQARSLDGPDAATGISSTNQIARSLQPQAKQLQYQLTSDQINKELALRHSTQHLMKQGKMYSDQMANSIQPAAVDLEGRLHGRAEHNDVLAAKPGLDPKLQEQAYNVNKSLQSREHSLSTTVAPSLQSAAKKIATHHRKMTLTKSLDARPAENELLAKGVLYAPNEKMSATIQGSAVDLENSLIQRPKEDELAQKGIIENANMDPSLRANANALENALSKQSNNKDGQNEGGDGDVLSPRGAAAPKLQSAIKALEFQQKNLALKKLLESQNKDEVNPDALAERFGLDNKLAPALQGAAKQLESEQRKLKLSKQLENSQAAKQEYMENESGTYKMGLASSLRETAQQLAKQRRRDSLTRGLNARSKRDELIQAQILFDDGISPAIQSQAMSLAQQLDFLRKKGMISSLLDQKRELRRKYDINSTEPVMPITDESNNNNGGRDRTMSVINSKESEMLSAALNKRPDSVELVKAGILHATPEVAHAIHDTINQLEGQLGKRLTTEQLRDLGIMGNNPQMANALQPAAQKLAGLLASQMKKEVKAQQLARSLQSNATQLEKNMNKNKLKQHLDSRQEMKEVADSGIIHNAGVASSIAGNAYDLENELRGRSTTENLESRGIIKDPKKHVKVGDHIKLNNGLTGKVKWIGNSDVTGDELIGIALDYYNSMGNNGTIGDRRYFIVDDGFGIYATRSDISQYVSPPRPLVSQAEVDALKQSQRAGEEAEARRRRQRVKEIRGLLAQIGELEAKAKEYGTFTALSNDEKRLVSEKRKLEEELNELTKRRLSLTLENAIVKRPTPEQMVDAGILKSFDISPALQSAAYLLESKLRRRKSIDQIALNRMFGNEGIYDSIDEMNVDFDKAINALTQRIQRRPSVTAMQELNILKAAQTVIAPRIHGARDELDKKLRRRMSVTDMQNRGLLPSNFDQNEPYFSHVDNMNAMNDLNKYNTRSMLQSSLQRRPSIDQLIDQGVIKSVTEKYSDDRRRRSIELDLNERLKRRPSIVKLEHQGILPYGATPLAASQKQLQRRRLSMTLKEKLKERVAREVLLEMGLLLPHQDTNFSRNLSGAAHDLSRNLKRRPSLDKIHGTLYHTPESAQARNDQYQSLQNKLTSSLAVRPTMSSMIQKDMIQHASMNDFVITIYKRPAGIRFTEGTNYIGLYVDEVRPESTPELLGVSKNDLLVSINSYNVEKLHSNKVINLFRTMNLPMHVRFRKNGQASHASMIQHELAQGRMAHQRGASVYDNNDDESDISPLGSRRASIDLAANAVVNEAAVTNIVQKIMAENTAQLTQMNQQLQALMSSKSQSDKQLKKMNRTLDLMKTEINSLRIEKVRWKQESDRLAKQNSDLVDRILVLDHELEQMKAEMARVDGEYALSISKRPIGVTWAHANNRTQLKVATVEDSSFAELFNVESGDVITSINNHNVENIDSDRVLTWFEKCPLPMNVTLRRKEANLELERAKYALEKQRKEIWDRLNAKGDSDSDDESEYSDDDENGSDDDEDLDESAMSDNSVKVNKNSKQRKQISGLKINKPSMDMAGGAASGASNRGGGAAGGGGISAMGSSGQLMMTQKSMKKLPTTPRALSTQATNDPTDIVIKGNDDHSYQKSTIDALELEMKLELERLQKYNETGDDNVLTGGLTPLASYGMGGSTSALTTPHYGPNASNRSHHRLETLEKSWDWQKGSGTSEQQFTPQQLLQIQKLLEQQQAQMSLQPPQGNNSASPSPRSPSDHSMNSPSQQQQQALQQQQQEQQEEKPKKKKKKVKKSKGIGAIASRFE